MPRMRHMTTTSRPIASYLHDHMVRTGRTEAEVGDLLGVDQTQVSRWRRGATVPRPANLEALAELLEVDVAELDAARGVSERLRVEVAERRAGSPEAELAEVRAENRRLKARIRRLEEQLKRKG